MARLQPVVKKLRSQISAFRRETPGLEGGCISKIHTISDIVHWWLCIFYVIGIFWVEITTVTILYNNIVYNNKISRKYISVYFYLLLFHDWTYKKWFFMFSYDVDEIYLFSLSSNCWKSTLGFSIMHYQIGLFSFRFRIVNYQRNITRVKFKLSNY